MQGVYSIYAWRNSRCFVCATSSWHVCKASLFQEISVSWLELKTRTCFMANSCTFTDSRFQVQSCIYGPMEPCILTNLCITLSTTDGLGWIYTAFVTYQCLRADSLAQRHVHQDRHCECAHRQHLESGDNRRLPYRWVSCLLRRFVVALISLKWAPLVLYAPIHASCHRKAISRSFVIALDQFSLLITKLGCCSCRWRTSTMQRPRFSRPFFLQLYYQRSGAHCEKNQGI